MYVCIHILNSHSRMYCLTSLSPCCRRKTQGCYVYLVYVSINSCISQGFKAWLAATERLRFVPSQIWFWANPFFPTCQVRVVRFYVSCRLLLPPPASSSSSSSSLSSSSSSLSSSNCDPRSTVFSAGPQPRPSKPSVPCRTSTTTIPAQCSLPDLNHDHPRPVFPAGPQPRPSTPSVPCRTSTASIHAKCSLPDLM